MRPGSRHWVSDLIFGLKKFRRLRNERNYRSRTQKRSGIPIAPSGTESAAGRDNAKRPPPSLTRRDCCGRCERFPRKDPGVLDLLGSSLSCDGNVLAPFNKHLYLRFAEHFRHQQKHPKQVLGAVSTHGFEGTSTNAQGGSALLQALLKRRHPRGSVPLALTPQPSA